MSDAHVLLQPGHVGGLRNSGSGSTSTTGSKGQHVTEPQYVAEVAAMVAPALEAVGITTIVEDAFYDRVYQVDLAVSIHLDGISPACNSGPSIGYPSGSPPGSNKPTADRWRTIWTAALPTGPAWVKWMPDNFTGNLSGYYGYAYTQTTIAELLVELAELSCPAAEDWLLANKHVAAQALCTFVAAELRLAGKWSGSDPLVPAPAPPPPAPPPLYPPPPWGAVDWAQFLAESRTWTETSAGHLHSDPMSWLQVAVTLMRDVYPRIEALEQLLQADDSAV